MNEIKSNRNKTIIKNNYLKYLRGTEQDIFPKWNKTFIINIFPGTEQDIYN